MAVIHSISKYGNVAIATLWKRQRVINPEMYFKSPSI